MVQESMTAIDVQYPMLITEHIITQLCWHMRKKDHAVTHTHKLDHCQGPCSTRLFLVNPDLLDESEKK